MKKRSIRYWPHLAFCRNTSHQIFQKKKKNILQNQVFTPLGNIYAKKNYANNGCYFTTMNDEIAMINEYL